MAIKLPVFASESVRLAWGGIPLEGLADDTFVTFSYNVDRTDEVVGADGSVGVDRSADKTGTCTATFMQTSKANLILSGVLEAQEVDPNLLISAGFTVVDPSGSVLARMGNAHIKTPPEVSLGKNQTPRSWTFFVEKMNFKSVPEGIADAAGVSAEVQSAINLLKNII